MRHVYRPFSGQSPWKLTQKLEASLDGITSVFTTTMYLTEQEYTLLLGLEGRPVHKNRFPFRHDGRFYGIDVFQGSLSELILAETGCASDEELSALTPPYFAGLDVSHEEVFTGGALAVLGWTEALALLERFKIQLGAASRVRRGEENADRRQ